MALQGAGEVAQAVRPGLSSPGPPEAFIRESRPSHPTARTGTFGGKAKLRCGYQSARRRQSPATAQRLRSPRILNGSCSSGPTRFAPAFHGSKPGRLASRAGLPPSIKPYGMTRRRMAADPKAGWDHVADTTGKQPNGGIDRRSNTKARDTVVCLAARLPDWGDGRFDLPLKLQPGRPNPFRLGSQ